MQCQEVMDRTHPIVSVGAPMSVAQRLFAVSQVSFLPVCRDNGEFAGVLRDQEAREAPVDTIESGFLPGSFVVLQEDDPVPEAALETLSVVVVNHEHIVMGVIDPLHGSLVEAAMKNSALNDHEKQAEQQQDYPSAHEVRGDQGSSVDLPKSQLEQIV